MIHRNTKTSTVYLLVVFLMCASACSFLLYTLLSFSLRNVRYSKFYIPRTQDQLRVSHEARVTKALQYLSKLPVRNTTTTMTSYDVTTRRKKVDVCVGIASVDRTPHKYLSITLASVLKGLSKEERDKYGVQIFVLDTEPNPGRNMEAKSFMGKHPDLFEVVPTNLPYISDWYQKEVLDYVQILRLCASVSPKYAIILEDDTMATNHYVTKFMKYVDNLPPDANYMDIKLFYPEFYCGFSELGDILILILCAALFSALLSATIWRFLLSVKFKHTLIVVLIFFYLLAAGIVVPLVVGKQNIVWCWKFGIHPFTATAFTNAVAYPSSKLDFIAETLETQYSEKAVDLLLDRIAVTYDLTRYLILPNLFQHIGVYSSNAMKNQGYDYHLKTSMSFVED